MSKRRIKPARKEVGEEEGGKAMGFRIAREGRQWGIRNGKFRTLR